MKLKKKLQHTEREKKIKPLTTEKAINYGPYHESIRNDI